MVDLTFLGDISFNDAGKDQKLDFSQFLELNSNSDFTIANLEALISTDEINLLKKPRVTTSEKALSNLEDLGISMVTLAHNHLYDAKFSGYEATIKKLEEFNIPFIGAGLTKTEAEKPYILHRNNLKIGFLNYCTEDTNPNLPEGCEVFLNIYHPDKIVKDLKSLRKQCQHVILILHWGGTFEGGYFPDKYQISDADKFKEAGADLIVGHHSHTLQPNIIIDRTPVYFSLGNFIFFDVKQGNKIKKLGNRRKTGGVLMVKLSKSKIENVRLYFSTLSNKGLKINTNNVGFNLRRILFKNLKKTSAFWKCYAVQYRYINPIFYFLLVQEGGVNKIKGLSLSKIKRYLWKK